MNPLDTLTNTQTGFVWGPMTVTRLISDDRYGVVLEVKTASGSVEIHSTPKGTKVTVQPTGNVVLL